MAKGSQLNQLKAALSDAGLSSKSHSKPNNKKRKRSESVTLQRKDKDNATKKLEEIHKRLNPFDVKVTKLKHDVGGRKLKGVMGRPGLSKQAGIELRKKTLLVEYQKKGHVGGIVDKRFGENDPSMAPEERMLERFTRERQRASKSSLFNLEDEDELTHFGQSLSGMDDFDGAGLGLDVEGEEDTGQIDMETVRKTHFGGFDDESEDEDPDAPPKKKSKAEVMSEVIAKSKEHKFLRQQEREAVNNARFQVDQDFDSIRNLIFQAKDKTDASALSEGGNDHNDPSTVLPQSSFPHAKGDEDYDQLVRQLAFEKRSRPKDRTKTDEELALEEKETLEKAERARLRRMRGEDGDSDEDVTDTKGRQRPRQRGGDDLDDDFIEENHFAGLGAGLEDETFAFGEGEFVAGGTSSDRESDEATSDVEGADDDQSDTSHQSEKESLPLVSSSNKDRKKTGVEREIPFTFPCPESHDDFLSIMEDIDDTHTGTVVQRIRSLHHPSLSKDNPAKLKIFLRILIEHVLHVSSPPKPRFSVVEVVVPHIFALTSSYPVTSAEVCVEKLSLMHKNLVRGLSQGATSLTSRTWPGSAELGFLRLLGLLWSTSDMNHAVISAARILMGAYLGLCRIRSTADVASGVFLCTLYFQFEKFSKRLVPEAINFLLNVVLYLAPHTMSDLDAVPGTFPVPDFNDLKLASLKLTRQSVKGLCPTKPELPALLNGKNNGTPQALLNLLSVSFHLLDRFGDLYKGLDGFIELYTPVYDVLVKMSLDGFPDDLLRQCSRLQETLTKSLKFAKQSRRPLLLQAHKPIPIPTYIPRFGSTSSNYLKTQDPDRDRAALTKLRNQVKQERKGAIRELRKDARFLAEVQLQKEVEESKGYNERMKKAFTSIEGERAEQKSMEREKARKKKRAGRK